jgi:hypothetical protein
MACSGTAFLFLVRRRKRLDHLYIKYTYLSKNQECMSNAFVVAESHRIYNSFAFCIQCCPLTLSSVYASSSYIKYSMYEDIRSNKHLLYGPVYISDWSTPFRSCFVRGAFSLPMYLQPAATRVIHFYSFYFIQLSAHNQSVLVLLFQPHSLNFNRLEVI